jgi:signal transducing adaptor molecule
MPEPSATELAEEAKQEGAVFAQAMNVEKLLNMLRALDPAKDNVVDDEEIQVGTIIFSCSLCCQCLIF